MEEFFEIVLPEFTSWAAFAFPKILAGLFSYFKRCFCLSKTLQLTLLIAHNESLR